MYATYKGNHDIFGPMFRNRYAGLNAYHIGKPGLLVIAAPYRTELRHSDWYMKEGLWLLTN